MATVKGLYIKQQTGTDNQYYAWWEFSGASKTTTSSSSSSVKVGDYVTIKSGSTWYNGVAIPSWVFQDSWKVGQITGDRAVLRTNKSGNDICSPIKVGNLVGGSGSSSSSSTTTTESSSNLDYYEVKWYYDSGDSIWFQGSSSQDNYQTSTYSPPDNAVAIKVYVRPVSKTYTVNNTETSYWSGTAQTLTYNITTYARPEKPSTPSIEIDKFELTSKITNISDPRTDEIQFSVYNGTESFATGTATVKSCMASYKCNVNAGGTYRVRARAANITTGSNRAYSDWTDFTSETTTIPSAPSGITSIKGNSSTSVSLAWSSVTSADSYDIEYSTKESYFDNSSETKKITGIEFAHYEVTGLDTGNEYFFRVRAVNEKGESSWTAIKSVVIGKKPSAPTTWSSTTTAIVGQDVTFYWVHNSEDGSNEKYAQLEYIVDGGKATVVDLKNVYTNEDDQSKTQYYTFSTTGYSEGATIKWRVSTAGVTGEYGDWSVQRTVEIYAPPTLALTLTNQNGELIEAVTEFPFYIKAVAGPNTQAPIGYHVTITADSGYETVDNMGNDKTVAAGEEVYSQYYDTSEVLLLRMSADSIDLQGNINYTLTVVVSMNSGLTSTATTTFGVAWEDVSYILDAEIAIDSVTRVAYVTPYCQDEDGNPEENVEMSVYRREFDGTFTEIATGLPASANTVVTDPHPALDYARYRIVAIDTTTGAVSYYDPPGYPVGCTSIIIQWDEKWSEFDTSNGDVMEEQPWNGSYLELPYNVDVTEKTSRDSTLVDYIGREYPVSYYGTKVSTTPTWSVSIPKTDKDTIYALRRLALYAGDVYVREPSGAGYWANIGVSFNKKHLDLTIPVSLSITRVSGGM
jgi:hypothetical protein